MPSRRVRDEVFRRNVRGLLREIGNAGRRVGVHIRGQHVAVGAQGIGSWSEGRRLRRSPRRRIRKNHGAIQSDRVGGAIQMRAVSLPRALGIMETDVPGLVDVCPFARLVKLRNEFAR